MLCPLNLSRLVTRIKIWLRVATKRRLIHTQYAGNAAEFFFTSPVFKGSSEARNQVGTIYAACVAAGDGLDAAIDGIFETAVNNTKLKM